MAVRQPTSTLLAPYLPRLVLEWPDQRGGWRAIDGSLVFVDISGFTALSERLAKRGRQGAEELTGTLSHCFGQLLSVAYAAGGSLLKFGGDALLLLFDGDDHAHRAATSALHMRTMLSTVGKVNTSVGSFRLRMSVGVHSGELHFFQVGHSHRELIVAGPGATATVEMESSADAGEIVMSPATAARIPARFAGAAKGSGLLLRRRSVEPVDTSDFPKLASLDRDVVHSIPVALRDELVNGTVESEHRHATVAFIHFDKVDEMLVTNGAGALHAALDELVTAVQEAADEHRVTFLGTDIDRDGGKIILVGGAPTAVGDDESRMLRALRTIADRRLALPVRIGVNHGHVFVGEVGPSYRRTYTVMGDAVNLAARVMSRAEPGEVLATSSVLERSRTAFETTPLAPFNVKGKSQPVHAFSVGEVLEQRADTADPMGSCIGRDTELSMLADAVELVRVRRGGLVRVAGPAGIGKSHLVKTVCARAGDARVVRSFCEPFEVGTPYFGVRYIVRGLLDITSGGDAGAKALRRRVEHLAPSLLPWLPLLADVADVPATPTPETRDLAPRFRQQRTRWVVAELVRAAADRPTIVVIDDAHWLDAVSADLVDDLAREARDLPLLIIVAGRDDSAAFDFSDAVVANTITLAPLTDDASAAIVAEATIAAPLRPHEREAIVTRAGGNPLFLRELLEARARSESTDELPESLEILVATEIDRLDPEDRRLLRYAAVLGATFASKLLADVVDRDHPRSSRSAITRRLGKFIEPAGRGLLRFRNQCYRHVAYETLPFGRRRELHGRAAEAIERLNPDVTEYAGSLSLHHLHAQQYERCWKFARIAAVHAEAKYANAEAAELYERALFASRYVGDIDHDDLATSWESLANVAAGCGNYEQARKALGRARTLRRGDVSASAALCRQESVIALELGQRTNAARWLMRGLRLVEHGSGAEEMSARAQLRAVLAQRRYETGRLREAIALCERAIDDAARCGDQKAMAAAYTILDSAWIALGQPAEATHVAAALEILENIADLEGTAGLLTFVGAFDYWQGRWDDAIARWEKGRDLYVRAGNVVDSAFGTCNIGEVLTLQGRYDEARTHLEEASSVFRSVHNAVGVSTTLLNFGRIALRQNDPDRAIEHFEDAKKATTDGDDAVVVDADSWIAECLLRRGVPLAALEVIDATLARERATGSTTFRSMLHRLRGAALVALERADDAWPEFAESLEIARARDAGYDIALTLETMAAFRAREQQPSDLDEDAERLELLERLGIRETPFPLF